MLNRAQQQIFTKAVEAMAAMTSKPVLYGPNGDAIRQTISYSLRRDAAKKTGSLKNWNPREVFSNQTEARERSDIVRRSVDLSNNDPHAAGSSIHSPQPLSAPACPPCRLLTPTPWGSPNHQPTASRLPCGQISTAGHLSPMPGNACILVKSSISPKSP